jgi:hypothetical protein
VPQDCSLNPAILHLSLYPLGQFPAKTGDVLIGSEIPANQLEVWLCSSKSQRRQLFGNFGNRPSPDKLAACDAAQSNRKITKPSTITTVRSEAIKVDLFTERLPRMIPRSKPSASDRVGREFGHYVKKPPSANGQPEPHPRDYHPRDLPPVSSQSMIGCCSRAPGSTRTSTESRGSSCTPDP